MAAAMLLRLVDLGLVVLRMLVSMLGLLGRALLRLAVFWTLRMWTFTCHALPPLKIISGLRQVTCQSMPTAQSTRLHRAPGSAPKGYRQAQQAEQAQRITSGR